MRPVRSSLAVAAALSIAAVAAAAAEPGPEAATAQPWTELHASRARLIAGGADSAGAARLAGLQIEMADGWKTYWRTPGDAGVPPQFDWSGSTNVADVKVLYPAPKRMPEAGGEVIGYKGAVLFPIAVTPQDPAKPVALKLALEFGICREICVPASATFELALPPARKAASANAADPVAAALDRVPRAAGTRRPGDPELRQVTLSDDGTSSRLIISADFHGGKGADVFVEAPDGLYVPLPHPAGQADGGITRYEVGLSRDLARDLKGRTLTITLVSEAGAAERQWTLP